MSSVGADPEGIILRLQTTRGRLLASTMICGAALAAFATAAPALAQDGTEVEAVVITGSRIARQDYVANSPIATVTGDQAVANADVTLDTYLNTLPQVNPSGGTTSNNPPNNGQSNVDLRGLGSNRNLVLVDGRRPMVSSNTMAVDLNTIPQALVDSIEVITGGAGATYGADAVAGVVNLKLKKNFEGVDVRASYSNSTEFWDAEEYQFSAVLGGNFADGKGNAVLAFDRSYREAMSKGQRAFSAIATSTTGTPPEGAIRFSSDNAIPVAAAQALFTGKYGINAPVGTGTNMASGSLGFNLDGTLFYGGLANNSTLQVQNYKYPIDVSVNTRFYPDFYSYNFDALNLLTLPMDRYSFLSKINYKLDNDVEIFGQVGWTQYTAATALAPTPLPTVTVSSMTETSNLRVKTPLLENGANVGTNLLVNANNKFIPADLKTLLNARTGDDLRIKGSGANEPFLFGFRPLGFGPRLSEFQNTVVQYMGGVRAPISEKWTFEATLSQGRTQIDLTQYGNIDTQRLQNILADPNQMDGGNAACADNNFFGDRSTTAACRRYLESPVSQKTKFEQTIAQAFVTGPVAELPAGEMQVVFGAEYRGFEYSSVFLSTPGPFSGFTVGDPEAGSNAFYDLFTEASIPLVKDAPWAQSLELALGARYSWSEFEDKIGGSRRAPRGSASYKIELNWQPIDFARVRGSYQRAVREPNFSELFAASDTNPQIFDPCSAFSAKWQANPSGFRALCMSQGVASTGASTSPGSQASLTLNGNTNLRPEKADTYTVGVVVSSPWDSQWLTRLRGSIDYYNIEVSDPILLLDTNTVIAECYNYFGTNPTYSAANKACQAISRSGGSLTNASLENPDRADGRFPTTNGGIVKTSGLDIQLDYGFDWEWLGLPSWMGSFQSNLLLTHVIEFAQADKEGLPPVDFTGTIAYFGAGLGQSFPKWKGVLSTRWDLGETPVGDLSFGLRTRYIDNMRNRQFAQFTGENFLGIAGVSPNVPATWYFDVDARWGITDNVELVVGVNNVADTQPRVYGPNVQSGTDPSTYDVVGRRVFGQVKLRF